MVEIVEVKEGVLQVGPFSESMVDGLIDKIVKSLLNLCHDLAVDEVRHVGRDRTIHIAEQPNEFHVGVDKRFLVRVSKSSATE